MKATAQTFSPAVVADKGWIALLADLFKARLTLLVLLTTLVGFYLASAGPVDYWLMAHALMGTGLVASGAAALNQLWERQYDARMRRTADRPLPSGRLQPGAVLRIGCGLSLAGLVHLALGTNLLTAGLGAASLLLYLFLYTPLKRVTWLNTAVGAIPGALPPLMGWTAVRGSMSVDGLSLFAILALWQIPHFMAIAWLYRDEYARAGFRMLPYFDEDGRRTGQQSLWTTVGLVPASLLPYELGLTGPAYLAAAVALGLLFLWTAVRFSMNRQAPQARQLFFLSIIYLPLLLIAMVLDKAG